MKFVATVLPEVVVIEPSVFGDDRGYFFVSWEKNDFSKVGIYDAFVQEMVSFSRAGVIRGLHFQNPSGKEN